MLYRPKFCCECGEKIERLNWKLWTNRRFCEVCDAELKLTDILPKAGIAVALIMGLFGLGTFLPGNQKTTPEIVKHSFASTKVSEPATEDKAEPKVTSNTPSHSVTTSTSAKPAAAVITSPETEPTYYCGAATRKGTPCSRRVKSNVRCWQHAGMPQMARSRNSTN